MTKKYTAHFRYEDDEARSIKTILDYIQENAPGTDPNTSDAIRFALLTKAADIRMEKLNEASGPSEQAIKEGIEQVKKELANPALAKVIEDNEAPK